MQGRQVYVLQVGNKPFLVLYDDSTKALLPVDGLLKILGDDYLQSFGPSSSHLFKFLLSDLVFTLQRLQPLSLGFILLLPAQQVVGVCCSSDIGHQSPRLSQEVVDLLSVNQLT